MLAAPKYGFVFLAMPKCASTAIESAIRRYCQIQVGGTPELKHTNYGSFERWFEPFLANRGHPRESYEVVCVFREPADWLSSWYRYRSRRDHRRARNSTRGVSFEQFVRDYVTGGAPYTPKGSQARFVSRRSGEGIGPDRIYRYEDVAALAQYLSERVGSRIDLDARNVSPGGRPELPGDLDEMLRAHLARDYDIYEHRTVRTSSV
jgi:hypothetical protein